jgi:hypothetical protein
VDAYELHHEIVRFINVCPPSNQTALDCLNYIHLYRLDDIYPNLSISLRILLTVPISVASGERSFSKLKIIKNYLRSTMCQQRLNGLASIAIENDIARRLNYEKVIDEFACRKSRKVHLLLLIKCFIVVFATIYNFLYRYAIYLPPVSLFLRVVS